MSTRLEQRVEALRDTVLDARFKGIPLGCSLRLSEIGERVWNVARGDLALPVLTLRLRSLDNNVTVMAEYCRRAGVLLAPHGKTTMAPQLFLRQLAAGAWGITAATPTQAAVMRDFGVERIVIANEVVEPGAVRWIASQMNSDPDCEIFTLVDDVGAVRAIDRALMGSVVARRLPVMVEVGCDGGRAGVRTRKAALEVARTVADSRYLCLAGVETYEGLAATGAGAMDIAAVDSMLAETRVVVEDLLAHGLLGAQPFFVSAGGSAYFDRVVKVLGTWPDGVRARVVLRSGCYITHDHGRYRAVSPLDGRRQVDLDLHLEDSLEGWARVVSRPEKALVILGVGRRDVPFDAGLPTPLTLYRNGGHERVNVEGRMFVERLMDQHAFVKVPSDLDVEPGDIVSLGVSHPCTAFDKNRLVLILDDMLNVVDAVLTYF